MSDVLLELQSVFKSYPAFGQKRRTVISNLSFCIYRGESVGLVGPNGSGKSTIARLILGLEKPDKGEVLFQGKNIHLLSGKLRREHFRQAQMVWQDPTVYLNPYQCVLSSIIEPMAAFGIYPKTRQKNIGLELMETLGLPASLGFRKPSQLSAGQCQRVALVRALSVNPQLLICDEALVNLDLPQQVRIIKLLQRLQKSTPLSILFISHDRDTVKKLCSRTLTTTQ